MPEETSYSMNALFEKGFITLALILVFFIGISERLVIQATCIGVLLILFTYSFWRKFVVQSVFTGVSLIALLIILFT
jgi:hypothetical protein